jgi:hypothetical protein
MTRMAAELKRDPDFEWLDHVRPVGLVVAPVLLRELGLAPMRQTQADNAAIAQHVGDDSSKPAFNNPWAFFERVLGWKPEHVAGSPGGPKLQEKFHVRLPDQDTTLSPTWAVAELGVGNEEVQLLVRIEAPGIDPDARAELEGWEATPHQRFERLLRETGIFAGLLITEKTACTNDDDRYIPELRVIYAPSGETSGHLTFPLRPLASVAGRPMLGGLKLLLDSVRLFTDADERRLPSLLLKSREAQAAVSTALAEQVLGALHDLLRGFDAAEPKLIGELAQTRAGHLYEGLLTVLMRLVFILYAEDRDLLPSRLDGRAREIYETSYSVRGLYARLVEDFALNPDTMDERRGAWGRLLSLFRLIHKGHPSQFIQARGGKLFDPDAFPFLEGRAGVTDPPRVSAVSDGCMLRILEGLMTLQLRGAPRERLSYRALDVEQIGSVYEIVMGFTVENATGRSIAIRAGKNNRTPVFVDLEKLAAVNSKGRIKFLKEEADRGQLSANVARAVEAARTPAELAIALDPIVDERGSPRKHEIAVGTPILQPTEERRRTGSHYTPRSLTEPIVRHALEPAFERLGPDATPEQILDLKVCDPAMGSGAFLVEACRALAARLVDAWSHYPEKKPIIPPDEDEELHARRLVAQRCLYGVDKNPLATDLAKLSLWLTTLARDHEFTFLDHALKSGDSLVGLTQAQMAAVRWDLSRPDLPLFQRFVNDRVAEVMKGRTEIQAAPDDTARAIQEARHRSLEERIKDIRLIGDAVIAAFFAEDKPQAREKKRAEVESWLGGSPVAWDKLTSLVAALGQGPLSLRPFHWEIEFPEAFDRQSAGFDVVVGNPPFMGGTVISAKLGMQYFDFLTSTNVGAAHHCDLIAYFFRRAHSLLSAGGALGLIATNTISQGDTREGGLAKILRAKSTIYRAIRRFSWPGEAAVIVCIIHILKAERYTTIQLDGRPAKRISAYLARGDQDDSPKRLATNPYISLGTKIYGQGFLFSESDKGASPLDAKDAILAKYPGLSSRILPYVGGDEVNSHPTHQGSRFVIFLSDITNEDGLASYKPLVDIVREKVLPERSKLSSNPNSVPLKKRWWAYQAHRPELYKLISERRFVIAISQTTKYICFAVMPTGMIFSQKLNIVASDSWALYASVQSRVHEQWALQFGSTLKNDPVYTIAECYETFPFPDALTSSSDLEDAGRTYHDYRAALMLRRNEGMTKTYNRFHDRAESTEEIKRLRELHAAVDRAVLEAYGWDDLAARAKPIFLDESNEDDRTYQGRLFWPSNFRDEVFAHLLALNAQRHSKEVGLGIAAGMKGKADDESDNDVDAE